MFDKHFPDRSDDCVCGCAGYPLNAISEGSVDFKLYRNCPARLRRRSSPQYKLYKNDPAYIAAYRGFPSSYIPILTEKLRVQEEQKLEEAQRKRLHRIELVYAEKLSRETKKQEERQISIAAEMQRESVGQPALSLGEAKRRGLETFLSSPCAKGHTGMRSARMGECLVCRGIDKSIRAAMKRGAFPENLSPNEREQIFAIYKKARKTSKDTGILHHVDHIVPLAAGGRHHPSNLQILTAEDNLKKGTKLDWSKASSTRKANRSKKSAFGANHHLNELREVKPAEIHQLPVRNEGEALQVEVENGPRRSMQLVTWLRKKWRRYN